MTLESFLFDAFLLCSGLILLTGGRFLFPDGFKLLADQKPWIHRLAVAVFAAAAAVWGIWRETRVKKGKAEPSAVIHFVTSLRFSFKEWTRLVFAVLFLTWTASSWIRHEVFHSSFDMAIFVQAVWNTLEGDLLYSSIKGGICLLADHFSPALILLALPYAVWTDPKCLLLLQALAAASCVFPIFALGKKILKHPGPAFLFVLAFAFYLPVRNAVRFDFHPEILAMPALLWAFFYLEKGEALKSSALLLFALLTKESAAAVTCAFGLYAFFACPRRKIFGAFWALFSTAYFFLVLRLIPILFHQDYFYLEANFLSWLRLGPRALLAHLFQFSSFAYLIKIFAPLAFFSFLDLPGFFLTVPMLAQNLLARNEAARSIFFQYTAYLTPFVFISAIRGGAKILKSKSAVYVLLLSILAMSGTPEYYMIEEHRLKQSPRLAEIRDHISKIPAGASVRTHEFFAPHLAHRKNLHIFENQNPREGGSKQALNSDYVILDRRLLGAAGGKIFNETVLGSYESVHERNGLGVFRRKS